MHADALAIDITRYPEKSLNLGRLWRRTEYLRITGRSILTSEGHGVATRGSSRPVVRKNSRRVPPGARSWHHTWTNSTTRVPR